MGHVFPSRWPTSTSEKPDTDNWDAWAAQPSLTVPSAGQIRQRSAFTPATATGSSPSPVLGQVRAVILYSASDLSMHLLAMSFSNRPPYVQWCDLLNLVQEPEMCCESQS
jgi:hypothetical protein